VEVSDDDLIKEEEIINSERKNIIILILSEFSCREIITPRQFVTGQIIQILQCLI
jgi:hypothetical protein